MGRVISAKNSKARLQILNLYPLLHRLAFAAHNSQCILGDPKAGGRCKRASFIPISVFALLAAASQFLVLPIKPALFGTNIY